MMLKVLHLRDDIDRLYVSRKERGFVSTETYMDTSVQGLKEYIEKCKERLITTASKSNIRKTTKTRKQKWEEKQLYEYLFKVTNQWNCTQEELDMAVIGKP